MMMSDMPVAVTGDSAHFDDHMCYRVCVLYSVVVRCCRTPNNAETDYENCRSPTGRSTPNRHTVNVSPERSPPSNMDVGAAAYLPAVAAHGACDKGGHRFIRRPRLFLVVRTLALLAPATLELVGGAHGCRTIGLG